MEQQNLDMNKYIDHIKNIQYLDFKDLENFYDFTKVFNLSKNENNSAYKESIECLYYFIIFNPDEFKPKYREFKLDEKIIYTLYEILDKLPKGTLKAKIASIILIESQNININKPKIAKIVIENFVYDFDKIFSQNYMQENNVFFALDLAYKFQLFDELDIAIKIKQVFNKQLNNTIDFKFTRLYQILTNRFYIWNKDEHLKILHRLYKIATKRIEELKTIIDIPQAQVEKNIICNILETILFIINKIKKDKKCKYIQKELYNKIIHINLEFSNIACNAYNGVALEALYYALTIAHKQNNKELITNINKKIQLLNEKILKTIKPISIPLSPEQQDCIEEYEKYLDDLLADENKSLFTIFMNAHCFKIDFDSLESPSVRISHLFPIIEYDSDNLISNIHEGQDDIFMDYRNCIMRYSCLCYILKTKLLQRFYPQKETFYPLVYNSNIIPKEYEELIARMLYCGIHNDYMDFFIYAGVSIEAILRNILKQNGCENIINKEDTQEYETLESMIKTIQDKKYLKENETKEIKLLFCKSGFNLRNKIAHARLKESEFMGFSWLCDYLWCFMMRIFISYYHKKPE